MNIALAKKVSLICVSRPFIFGAIDPFSLSIVNQSIAEKNLSSAIHSLPELVAARWRTLGWARRRASWRAGIARLIAWFWRTGLWTGRFSVTAAACKHKYSGK